MNPQSTFDEKLLRLIKNQHNNEEVKSIIEKKDLYNVTDRFKNTLLHIKAVKARNAEITRYLVDSGSKVDAQNQRGETPWMLAMESECKETVEFLIQSGAMELQNNLGGKSALQIIGDSDDATSEALSVLLPKLQSLCSNNKEEIATKLIGAHWPLQYVVDLKDSDLTRIVLQRSYATKIDDFEGTTLTSLYEAIRLVDVENVKVLLEYNASVNLTKHDGRTSLYYVYGDGTDRPKERLEILKMLLDRGAKIGSYHYFDYKAYEIFKYANRDAIKLLFQYDLDRSADCERFLILMMLAINENPGTIEEIRGRGFDVNARNGHNQTPLIIAAESGNTHTLEFLLNEGANIDAVDYKNCPAIFNAVNEHPKYERCVQLLLERGANVQYEIVSSLQDERTIFNSILSNKLFSLGELVVAHLALQEILGAPITKTIRSQINSCDRFKTHFESSKQQLLSMKVYESTTLSNLLTVITDEKFEMYTRNEDFVLKCENAVDALSGYRYFRTILKRRLLMAQTIAALKTGAARIISEIMGTSYDRFPLIADYIVSYLDHDDMKNLVTVKSNIRQIFY